MLGLRVTKICFLTLTLLLSGSLAEAQSRKNSTSSWVKERTTTVGNRSYIDLKDQLNSKEILEIIKWFEEAYPNREITSWKLYEGGKKAETLYTIDSLHVYGIWVDHKPKLSPASKTEVQNTVTKSNQ